jgi:hypothetical protein
VRTPGVVFRRVGGEGWIVLAEDLPTFGGLQRNLADRLLERVDLSRPPVCLLAPEGDPDRMESFLDDLEAMLGTAAAVIELSEASQLDWGETGLLVLAGGPAEAWVQTLATPPQEPSDLSCQGPEGLLLAAGPSAAALGSWILDPNTGLLGPGLGWLPGAILVPGQDEPSEPEAVRSMLASQSLSYAVAMPPHAVLALGPAGQVEVWSESRPGLALGKGWIQT